jgi:hypothetical protein
MCLVMSARETVYGVLGSGPGPGAVEILEKMWSRHLHHQSRDDLAW